MKNYQSFQLLSNSFLSTSLLGSSKKTEHMLGFGAKQIASIIYTKTPFLSPLTLPVPYFFLSRY